VSGARDPACRLPEILALSITLLWIVPADELRGRELPIARAENREPSTGTPYRKQPGNRNSVSW